MNEILGLAGEVFPARPENIDSLYVHYYSTMGRGCLLPLRLYGRRDGARRQRRQQLRQADRQVRSPQRAGAGHDRFEGNFLGSGTDGCMGQYFDGKVYASAYTNSSLQGAPTPAPAARNGRWYQVFNEHLQFEGYNLPTCGFLTNGGEAFAADREDYIYYANFNQQESATYLFKFDSLLNVVWMNTPDIGPYMPSADAAGKLPHHRRH